MSDGGSGCSLSDEIVEKEKGREREVVCKEGSKLVKLFTGCHQHPCLTKKISDQINDMIESEVIGRKKPTGECHRIGLAYSEDESRCYDKLVEGMSCSGRKMW